VKKLCLLLYLASLILIPATSQANTFLPAILFNSDTILDGSYNESLLSGIQRFEQRKGTPFIQAAASDPVTYKQSLKAFARAGRSPIIVPGAHIKPIVEAVAKAFPRRRLSPSTMK